MSPSSRHSSVLLIVLIAAAVALALAWPARSFGDLRAPSVDFEPKTRTVTVTLDDGVEVSLDLREVKPLRTIVERVGLGRLLGRAEAASPPPAADTPLGLMRRFETVYEGRDLEAYGGLFTEDFRFHFGDPDLAAIHPGGWTRADELASADHLFHGFVNQAGERLPRAESIALEMEPLAESADPTRPDSSAHYRVVTAGRLQLVVRTAGKTYRVTDARHEFHLVRGDAARLSSNQPASAERWYVRRWVEEPATWIASTPSRADSAGAAAPRLALTGAVPNPTTDGITVAFTLATAEVAHLTLHDVRGRRVRLRNVGQYGPGAHRVRLSSAGELGAGVYWVRLTQGDKRLVSQVTVLR